MRGFLHLILATVFGAVFGVISAMAMIQYLSAHNVAGNAGWQERRGGVEQSLAPYAISYFANQVRVPPPSAGRYFVRTRDDEGNFLRGDCSYEVTGKPVPSRWWSIHFENAEGESVSLGSTDMVFETDGSVRIFLAPYPVPGNRMLSPKGNSLTLSYAVYEPANPDEEVKLPVFTRLGC